MIGWIVAIPFFGCGLFLLWGALRAATSPIGGRPFLATVATLTWGGLLIGAGCFFAGIV